jgi:anti-anti-sigma regulatory factor
MLRISVQNGPLTKRLKLEGKLAHEWVGEAEREWAALTAANGEKTVVVDLFDVSFVDDSGWKLLAQMHHAGAKLAGSGPMMSALIEEIEGKEEALAEECSTKDQTTPQKEEELEP